MRSGLVFFLGGGGLTLVNLVKNKKDPLPRRRRCAGKGSLHCVYMLPDIKRADG